MDNVIWLTVMVPCSAVVTVIGIYARNRKKPMWFWSDTDMKESEISDVSAFNRANGRIWMVYSLPLWLSTIFVLWNETFALILIVASCVVGLPILAIVYKRIYEKYKS